MDMHAPLALRSMTYEMAGARTPGRMCAPKPPS